jgi:hypothetical protein
MTRALDAVVAKVAMLSPEEQDRILAVGRATDLDPDKL